MQGEGGDRSAPPRRLDALCLCHLRARPAVFLQGRVTVSRNYDNQTNYTIHKLVISVAFRYSRRTLHTVYTILVFADQFQLSVE